MHEPEKTWDARQTRPQSSKSTNVVTGKVQTIFFFLEGLCLTSWSQNQSELELRNLHS